MKDYEMNEETLTALFGSIKKWKGVAEGKVHDEGSRNCPLCAKFNTPITEIEDCCKGCPIFEKTGIQWCEGTPYESFRVCFITKKKEEAKNMLYFLIDLLP